jgi:PAS domain S-box-containing protein
MSGLKFLLLEDNLLDRELIQALLSEGGIVCDLVHLKTGTEFQTALEQGGFDLILSDYSLPGFDGIAALEMAKQLSPDVPFIFVTATMGEEVAIETMKTGATDYVLKQRIERLVPSVQRALRESEERRARQQAEAELYCREQELRAILENSPDIIARFDRELRYLYVNPVIKEATGLPANTFIGKTNTEVGFPQDIVASLDEVMCQVLKTGEGRYLEYELPATDGIRYYESRIVPEFGLNDKIESLLSITRDITQKKLAEQALRAREAQLRQQKEELEEANRIKDEFLAVLSHELRSPLNAILGWAKLLQNSNLDQTTFNRALETIERNTKLQTQLIEDLLDVSRIVRGKLSLHPQPISLIAAIEAALDTMRLAAQAKSIDLEFTISESLSPASNQYSNCQHLALSSSLPASKFLVLADPNRLQQIVWNLLSNAIKFTPQGGRVEVHLECREAIKEETLYSLPAIAHSPAYAQITVKDTGVGIKSEFLPYVFDSFRQADSSASRKYGGLGLGLAVVRHLVELHGGTITATSPGVGQGASFIVSLPLIEESSLSKASPTAQKAYSSPSTTNSPLKSIRVLVVDDDADSRDFLVFILEDCGATVTAVPSAAAALEVLLSSKPDVLISDIGMPDEDGYSFIRQVRKLPPSSGGKIPAIALTAYAGETNRHEALKTGFQQHLSKPVMPDELTKVIVELITQST